MFAIDVNGELSRHRLLNPTNRPIKILNLTDGMMEFEFSFDPFSDWDINDNYRLITKARELAGCIIPISYRERDPFWKESARIILAALMLRYFCLGDTFIAAISKIQAIPLGKQLDGIENDPTCNEYSRSLLAQFIGFMGLEDSKMMLGVANTLSIAIITLATDEVVRSALVKSENSMKWEDLETHDIFIRIDQSRLELWGNVIGMITTQLIRHLERRPNKYSPEGQEQEPILLLLDEFPAYGKMDVLLGGLSTLRGKNTTIALFAQSVAQLDLVYGAAERKVMLDNCSHLALLRVSDVEGQRYFAERIGYKDTKTTHIASDLTHQETQQVLASTQVRLKNIRFHQQSLGGLRILYSQHRREVLGLTNFRIMTRTTRWTNQRVLYNQQFRLLGR